MHSCRRYRAIALVAGLGCISLGCHQRSAVDSCGDALDGVWSADPAMDEMRAPSGELLRFHFVDRGDVVEVYPMFDDSRPPAEAVIDPATTFAPSWFAIRRVRARSGSGKVLAMTGERLTRIGRGEQSCTVTGQATIRQCRDNTLELSWVPVRQVDLDSCASIGGSRYRRAPLRRVR